MTDPPKPDDLCPRPSRPGAMPTVPLSPPIFLSSVYECRDPRQAEDLLSGALSGYVYSRDAHPNGDMLAERCAQLHGAERAAVTNSGMAALALAVLSQLQPGDHIVASNQLYGRSLSLLTQEVSRWGIESTLVDTCDLPATSAAFTPRTKFLLVETITNPLLRVCDLAALSRLAHQRGAQLLVDNTFAGPAICRPIELGADLVLESLTKTANGHSDVVLGLLCGPEAAWTRVPTVLSSWGLGGGPFESWLALRGLGTLALRMERAAANALAVAEFLANCQTIEVVHYPGLPTHPDHPVAVRQFGARFGSIVTFTLRNRESAEAFIAAKSIPFCPSLGELSTTLSHPESTSHRGLTGTQRAALGIHPGTLRLSVGIESSDFILAAIGQGLAAVR